MILLSITIFDKKVLEIEKYYITITTTSSQKTYLDSVHFNVFGKQFTYKAFK